MPIYIVGTDDDDTIEGFAFPDVWWIDGGGGNDYLAGWNGDDYLWGGKGNDILDGVGGSDHLYGGDGNDILFGAGYLNGGDGEDMLIGAGLLVGGADADVLDGNGYDDTAGYGDSDTAVTVTLGAGSGHGWGGTAEGDVLVGIENISGSAYDDVLTGDEQNNTLTGNGGVDVLVGNDGHDTLDGGAGNDFLWGNTGNDTLKGGDGADLLSGGEDSDTADYSDSFDSINVSLLSGTASGGTAEGDTLKDIENVTGGYDSDVLEGDNADNVLNGMIGNDTLQGLEGADLLMGGEFINPLVCGADAYFNSLALDGTNTASYEASNAGVHIELSPKNSANTDYSDIKSWCGQGYGGHAEGDLLYSIDNVIGSKYSDSLFGDYNANVLKGMDGGDQLYGFGGSDILDGGEGDDTLVGGDKDDTLIGGLGVDTMYGEDGVDVFKFLSDKECGTTMATADYLADFNGGNGDQIDLSAIDASSGDRGHQAFKFIGNNVNFTGAGEVRYNTDTGYVECNTNADLGVDLYIEINMATTPLMISDDFIFV